MRRKSIGVVGSSSEVMMKLALIGVVLLAVIWFIIPAVWRPQSENIEQATSSHNLRDANCKVQSFLQGGLDSDRDGVTDSCDVCLGASEKDKDGDGVPDMCDKEPFISGNFKDDCITIIDEKTGRCGPAK